MPTPEPTAALIEVAPATRILFGEDGRHFQEKTIALIRDRRLAGLQIGRRYYTTQSAIEAFLAEASRLPAHEDAAE